MNARAVLLGLIGLASCTPESVASPEPASGSSPAPSPTSAVASATAVPSSPARGATAVEEVPRPPPSPPVLQTLQQSAVYHDAVARKVLYAWTNACHFADIRQFDQLLYRTDLTGVFGLDLDERLRLRPTDPVAKVLSQPAFAHRRPAWPTTWGARLPLVKERGGVLLRIELRDDAVIAILDSELNDDWRFVAVNGAEVARDAVLRDPRKVAAIFEVWHGNDAESEPREQAPFAFRQYVLSNESMIASVEAGTPRLERRVARDVEFLEAMARYVEGLNEGEPTFSAWSAATVAAWRTSKADADALDLWNAGAPAVDADNIPDGERITVLRNDLNRAASFDHEPRTFTPRRPFGAKPHKPPPRRWALDPTVFFDKCPD